MELALKLARTALGQTSPNPSVGAVAVKNGTVIGVGVHMKAGEPHAEVHALNQAGAEAEGADLYVTLEPCSHHGRTPPCADLIIEKGVRRVFIATLDPNPLVAGRGARRLEEAGIEVSVGIGGAEARRIHQFFFHAIKTGKPYVTLKAAVTLDGKMATKTGDSKWITPDDARQDVHRDRSINDAILVGINTVLHDDPLLTSRLPQGGKNPVRVILDSKLKTPLDTQVVTNRAAKTLIVCSAEAEAAKQEALETAGVEVIRQQSENISLEHLLEELGHRGIVSLYVEGGAEVHGSFLDEGCFDQINLYMAPKLAGGRDAVAAFGGEGISLMSEAAVLSFEEVEHHEGYIKIIAKQKEA